MTSSLESSLDLLEQQLGLAPRHVTTVQGLEQFRFEVTER